MVPSDPAARPRVGIDEYLVAERASAEKHVYWAGEVFVPSKPGFVYPDVSVYCGEPHFHDDERDVLLDPTVVVEVLSDTTERFDRGDELIGYRSIPSLQQIVLVSQNERRVEVLTRDGDRWVLEDLTGDDTVHLRSIDCELPLAQLYRGIEPS